VPGPWRDPALLEWQRGGRFELKIFPIPKRGSRRVVLTYTQTVPQSAGIRRLNYPLAHDASGTTKIDDFELDVQVLGHDRELGVEPRGYALTRSLEGQAERLVLREQGFVPAGDLTLEYALPSRDAELTAWAYDPRGAQAPVVATPTQVAPGETAADVEARALVSDTSPYVAIALRPKLPKLAEGRERLHVLVVDSSRSMVGERYSRATRLASELVRSMDRRDQFVLLACDVECQAMGTGARGGLATPSYPGADGAAEVERFLGTIEPDGGSNLLAAVEAARTAAGAARDREIRVIYLGDGTPTVGPTRPSTVEAAVGHALPPGEGSIVAVALGADADTTSLAALARGGGGVVVPFVPGQSTRAAARGVLAAADGAVLRDVQIELPPGLTSVSPARIDPFVAGSEAFVFARMTQGTEVRGDVVVRGRVGSAPFEQRTPATIVASTSAGNAFVPRLFAASRIAELELSGNADDRARIVALSKQFQVASRHTSLLVLESEAMFKAFGLDRVASGPTFTGETEADSASADAKGGDANADADAEAVEEQSAALDDALDRSKSKKNDAPRAPAKGASAFGNAGPSGGGRASSQDEGFASPPPAPATPAPAVTSSTESKAPGGLASEPGWSQPSKSSPARRRPPQSLVPMRKVFDRKASFSPTNTLAAELGTKIAALEGEQRARPDSRDRTLALYQALMASGRVGEAQELTARWSQRDALDPEALLARADLAAMRGDRSRALRILSGLADVRPGDKTIPARLASAYAALGDATRACPFRITLAELDANDRTRAAEAVRCSQDRGLSEVASALVAGLPQARRAEVLTQSLRSDLVVPTVVAGDVRVTARWSGGSDLDLALVDKNGRRISWLGSTVKTILPSSKDVASTSTETLAVAGLPGGNYVVEVVRSDATGSRAPIAGELVFSLPGGESRVVPFQLAGERVEVGTIRVFFASRLVPVGGWSDQRSREW
jgi:Mg-chelatase subunit ChlD